MDWTDERVAMLKKLWQEGRSASEVAQLLGGLTRNAVIGKVHRLGLGGRATPSRPRTQGAQSAGRTTRLSIAAGTLRIVKPAAPVRLPKATGVELTPTATIHTLTLAACRWPIGDPRDPEFGFCGRACSDKGSYCQGHAQLAFHHRPVSDQRTNRRLEAYRGEPRTAVAVNRF
jgi:GcrA cell cycle regulator